MITFIYSLEALWIVGLGIITLDFLLILFIGCSIDEDLLPLKIGMIIIVIIISIGIFTAEFMKAYQAPAQLEYKINLENGTSYRVNFTASIEELIKGEAYTTFSNNLEVRNNADKYLYPRVNQFIKQSIHDNLKWGSNIKDLNDFCKILDGSYVDIPGASIKVKFKGLTMVGNRR